MSKLLTLEEQKGAQRVLEYYVGHCLKFGKEPSTQKLIEFVGSISEKPLDTHA